MLKNLDSTKFGRLTVIKECSFRRTKTMRQFWCSCDCGSNYLKLVTYSNLLSGTKSCGCLDKESRIVAGKKVSNFNIKYKTKEEANTAEKYLAKIRYSNNLEKSRELGRIKSKKYKNQKSFKHTKTPEYKIRKLVSSRIFKCLKSYGKTKYESTISYLGCNFEFYKKYIEKMFKPGMNWENHGKVWHIDHIKPISHFNLNLELHNAFNYKNTQPLFVLENLSKGNRYVG